MKNKITIQKRNGKLEQFDRDKISKAILKAMSETGNIDLDLAKNISSKIEDIVIEHQYSVEQIQDLIEEKLMDSERKDVAKRYILYREERNKLRTKGWDMTDLQKDILEQKYLHNGESFMDFIERVSQGNSHIRKMVLDKKFLPGGRILAGIGINKNVSLSNCYTQPYIEDNLESIFETAQQIGRTFAAGGGIGIDISNLRPKDTRVNNAAEFSSGAVSFMELYSKVTEVISQRGRRGALLISMKSNHPDIVDFIKVKQNDDKVTKANISVKVDNAFMEAVINDEDYETTFVINGEEKISRTFRAREVFNELVRGNYNFAEPGILYWDRVTEYNLGSENPEFEIVGVNACFTGDMRVLTKDGFTSFEELDGKEVELINSNGDISTGKVWYTGEKETIKVTLTTGKTITCTPDHVFMTINGEECQAQDLKGEKLMPLINSSFEPDIEYVKMGFMQGDGALSRLNSKSHKGLEVHCGTNDDDIRELFSEYQTHGEKSIYVTGYKEKLQELGFSQEPLPTRVFPTSYNSWTKKQKASFLQGCFSANGGVVRKTRISYKTVCEQFAKQLLETLKEDFGIKGYITSRKATKVTFANGTYLCKPSYDVNIGNYEGWQIFSNEINFYHTYKREWLQELLIAKAPTVRSIKKNGVQKVYDFNEPTTNWGIVEGFVAHNCSELPLPAFAACLLGSLNLSAFVKNPFTSNAYFDMESFLQSTYHATQYLDDVLEEGIRKHPLLEQKEAAEKFRQIGVGIMGLGDALIKLGLTYGEEDAISFVDNLSQNMLYSALEASADKAKELGAFPAYNGTALSSTFLKDRNMPKHIKEKIQKYGLRNASLISIAPTGTLSTLLGVSGGAEPVFAFSFNRRTESLNDGIETIYKVDCDLVKEFKAIHGDIELPSYFIASQEIDPMKRVTMQSTLQKNVDSAISSTVNLPNDVDISVIADIYIEAYKQGLKGITVYRDGCLREGILTTDKTKKKDEVCPECGVGTMEHKDGCVQCTECAYSPCSI